MIENAYNLENYFRARDRANKQNKTKRKQERKVKKYYLFSRCRSTLI